MVSAERELVVDGEVFLVRNEEGGGFSCVWLTGPNPGYGFKVGSSAGYSARVQSSESPFREQALAVSAPDDCITNSIRNFLSMIDPKTGFIGD